MLMFIRRKQASGATLTPQQKALIELATTVSSTHSKIEAKPVSSRKSEPLIDINSSVLASRGGGAPNAVKTLKSASTKRSEKKKKKMEGKKNDDIIGMSGTRVGASSLSLEARISKPLSCPR